MTGVLVLFTRCEQEKKRKGERGEGGRGEKTIRLKNLLQTPLGTLWLRVQVELQRFLLYLKRCSGSADPPNTRIYVRVRVRPAKNCHSSAPASNTKATSSHCVRPSPFIPFSTACTTTKAEKLGSCDDDRATNLFGGTHYISSVYSSAAEKAELNMDIQRWASLWKMSAPTMHCYYLWNNSYIPYGADALTQPSSLHLILHFPLPQGHMWTCGLQGLFCDSPIFPPMILSRNLHILLSTEGPCQIIKGHTTLHLNTHSCAAD